MPGQVRAGRAALGNYRRSKLNPDNPAGNIDTAEYMRAMADLSACRQERGRLLKQVHTYHVNRDYNLLHPKVRNQFQELGNYLHGSALKFRLFEGYRSPIRQNYLFNQRPPVTKAKAWESAHNFGMAADFVWFDRGEWSWDDEHPWDELRKAAKMFRLDVPISWDRGHVEAIGWQQYIG